MDILSKAYAQLAGIVQAMSPASRIAAGLVLAAVVAAAAWLYQFRDAAGDEYLLAGRPFFGDELTRAEAAFAKAGLNQSQVVDGNRVRVPRGKKEQYLAALAENDALPVDFYKYLDEAAAHDNPFSSARSLELRRANAKQKELALIIRSMRGITSATVQYDESARPGSLREQTHKTAMVAVKTQTGELDHEQIVAIRNIVAGSYAGLDCAHISINDITSGRTYTGAELDPRSDESAYAALKLQLERLWKQKIQDQLSWIPKAIVNVNVELSGATQDLPPVAAPALTSSSKLPLTVEGGRAGADAPVPDDSQSLSSSVYGNRSVALGSGGEAAESRDEKSLAQSQSEPAADVRRGLAPATVTAAIQYPASYLVTLWRQTHPTPSGRAASTPTPRDLERLQRDVSARIEKSVHNLLPPMAAGRHSFSQISVTSYDDGQEAVAAQPPAATALAGNWLADHWRSAAIVVIAAGLCLLMLRSAAARTASPAPTRGMELGEEQAGPTSMKGSTPKLAGSTLKLELQKRVEQDPDAAAAVLRNWIGDAV